MLTDTFSPSAFPREVNLSPVATAFLIKNRSDRGCLLFEWDGSVTERTPAIVANGAVALRAALDFGLFIFGWLHRKAYRPVWYGPTGERSPFNISSERVILRMEYNTFMEHGAGDGWLLVWPDNPTWGEAHMPKIDLGKLTEKETSELVVEALHLLSEVAATDSIVSWARASNNSVSDLILALQVVEEEKADEEDEAS